MLAIHTIEHGEGRIFFVTRDCALPVLKAIRTAVLGDARLVMVERIDLSALERQHFPGRKA